MSVAIRRYSLAIVNERQEAAATVAMLFVREWINRSAWESRPDEDLRLDLSFVIRTLRTIQAASNIQR
jgi:hypothetical protein